MNETIYDETELAREQAAERNAQYARHDSDYRPPKTISWIEWKQQMYERLYGPREPVEVQS